MKKWPSNKSAFLQAAEESSEDDDASSSSSSRPESRTGHDSDDYETSANMDPGPPSSPTRRGLRSGAKPKGGDNGAGTETPDVEVKVGKPRVEMMVELPGKGKKRTAAETGFSEGRASKRRTKVEGSPDPADGPVLRPRPKPRPTRESFQPKWATVGGLDP